MKPILLIFCCFAMFCIGETAQPEANPAAQEFTLDYATTDGTGPFTSHNGANLFPLEQAPDGLEGIPDPQGGRIVFFEAHLGENRGESGTGNSFPMVVVVAADGKKVSLTIDTDRDGSLSGETTLEATLRNQQVEFGPVDITIAFAGKQYPYRFGLRGVIREDFIYFTLHAMCYRRGTIHIAGRSLDAVLMDRNGNGTFNDADWRGDALHLSVTTDSRTEIWDSSPLTIILGDTWYYLEPKADGSTIQTAGKSQELVPVKTGFPSFSLEFSSPHTGCITLQSENGVVRLPPGSYRWNDYTVTHIDDQGTEWSFTSGTIMQEPFEVHATPPGRQKATGTASANMLELILPLEQRITTRTQGDVVTLDQQIVGRHGENVYVSTTRGSNAPATFTIDDVDGNRIAEGQFEAG